MRSFSPLAVFFLALASFAPGLPAQERGEDAVRSRLRAMQQHAERLRGEGRHEEAEAVAARIKEIRAQLRQPAGEERQARPGDDLREILAGLEQGMRSLRALGRRTELEAVERVAVDARERLAAIEREAEPRAPERRGGADRERQAARETIDALRMAREAILEAGRTDSAELVERAIAAREVHLEGRRDAEAMAIGERSPDHAAETELLAWGARLLREQGKPDRAEHVGKVADQFQVRYRQQAEHAQEGQRERATPPREGRGERGNADELAQRLQQMEEAMRDLHRQLEELRRQRIR